MAAPNLTKKTDKSAPLTMQEKAAQAAETIRNKYKDPMAVITSTSNRPPMETWHSGSIALDLAIGGGIPEGRVLEFYGQEASGKTTVALAAAGQVLARNEVVLFIDAEHAFNPNWARLMGVDINNPNFILAQPESAEQALEILQEFLRAGAIRMAVLDSVAALIPQSQLDGAVGEASVGLLARLMSQELRKIALLCSTQKATVIFINQLRANIKIGTFGGYGDPNTTTGGNALKFYASIRLNVQRIQTIKTGAVSTANRVKVTVKKNKVGVPYKSAEFDIDFERGISILGEIVDLATQIGLLTKRGAFYRYGEDLIGQGRDSARAYLRENQALAYDLHNKILAHFGLPALIQQPVYEGATLDTGANTFGILSDEEGVEAIEQPEAYQETYQETNEDEE